MFHDPSIYELDQADRARAPRPRSPVRMVARILCVVLAVVGIVPFSIILLARSSFVQNWAARESAKLIREQGLEASYSVRIRAWPLALELQGVKVEATDGRNPFVEAPRIRIRPRFFGLLSGVLAIDQIEVEAPNVRVVVRDGKLANLKLPETKNDQKKQTKVPFSIFSVSDATIDLDADGVRVLANDLDFDLSTKDLRNGQAFDVGLTLGPSTVQRMRATPEGTAEVDDDVICSLEGRAHIEPGSVKIRRLSFVGEADFDPAGATHRTLTSLADCKKTGDAVGTNRVEVTIARFSTNTPESLNQVRADGDVSIRLPVALAERFAPVKSLEGWISLQTHLSYGNSIMPEAEGRIDGAGLHFGKYRIAEELHSRFRVHENVIDSPETSVRIADGTAVLVDTRVEPLKNGIPVTTRLDATNISFTALMRDLGVHPRSHVLWDVREIHTQPIAGTLDPLKLDGDFSVKSLEFGVFTKPVVDPARERIIGFAEATVQSHLAVRPNGINFQNSRAQVGRSQVGGGNVFIGFEEDLRVDVSEANVNLEDISPIGPVPMKGIASAEVHVGGTFHIPTLKGTIHSIQNFVISDLEFGEIIGGDVDVDIPKSLLTITNVSAKKGRASSYDVPSAKLDLGGKQGFLVDAIATSSQFNLRDFLSIFKDMNDDPRFEGIDGDFSTRAQVHLSLGGPEDRCGEGYLDVRAKSLLRDVKFYGERFPTGEADFELKWYDRLQGISGADLDLRSFVLSKRAANGTGTAGTLLGSAALRRGGQLSANVVVDGVPLGQLDTIRDGLSAMKDAPRQMDGRLSAVAQVNGVIDDFAEHPGFVVQSQAELTGIRFGTVTLPPSQFRLRMTQNNKRATGMEGRTRCGNPIGPKFDKAAYLADASSHGEFAIDGEFFDRKLNVKNLVMTREKSPIIKGSVALRGFDFGVVMGLAKGAKASQGEEKNAADARYGGELWGQLEIDEFRVGNFGASKLRYYIGQSVLTRGNQKLAIMPEREPVIVANNVLSIQDPIELRLDTPNGFSGAMRVSGDVADLSGAGKLGLKVSIEPIDLAQLARFVPKVERGSGMLKGGVNLTGTIASPNVQGGLSLDRGELSVDGTPSPFTDIRATINADSGLVTASANAKFAGGTLFLNGSVPLNGTELGTIDAGLVARDIRIASTEACGSSGGGAVVATLNADLNATVAPATRGANRLPRVSGDITITSFESTCPMKIVPELGVFGGRTRQTVVDHYDPSLDAVALDVRVLARVPLKIRNNLADLQLKIDSDALHVTGTNQRFGLRGSLKAMPGGHFRFRSDFDIRQAQIRFDDPTRIAPNVDLEAVTEYRRSTDTTSGSAGLSASAAGNSSRPGLFRITLHAYGDAENLALDMTSEPALSREDIFLLLALGMTRSELDQLQASSVGGNVLGGVALNYLGVASGADKAVRDAIPVIDDFRFGSAYSRRTGKTEPQLTVSKRVTEAVRASVTSSVSQNSEVRAILEWRLSQKFGVQGSYDNLNTVNSAASGGVNVGNVGVDLRWRFEFE